MKLEAVALPKKYYAGKITFLCLLAILALFLGRNHLIEQWQKFRQKTDQKILPKGFPATSPSQTEVPSSTPTSPNIENKIRNPLPAECSKTNIEQTKDNFWEKSAQIDRALSVEEIHEQYLASVKAIEVPEELLPLLQNKDFLLIVVNLINDFAEGNFTLSPQTSQLIPLLQSSFSPQKQGDHYLPNNHAESSHVARVLSWFCDQVPARKFADLYINFEPKFAFLYETEVCQDGQFRQKFYQAMKKIQEYQFPTSNLSLTIRHHKFIFLNSEFESLSKSEKFLFRRGKTTFERVQIKISEILREISMQQ